MEQAVSLGSRQKVLDLVRRQREGWSLEQAFYTDPEIFALERELWFSRQWFVAGHESELPRVGAYIVREIMGESLIIVRADDDDIRAYYNVCSHRGSRICKGDGRGRLLVCPYHAWSFRLTGELQTTQDLPEGVDPAGLGLRAVSIAHRDGVILVGLGGAALPAPEPALEALSPALRRHGFDRAKILTRKAYPTHANWKLVMENFFECYHCRPAHPEYFGVNGHVCVTAVRDERAAADWAEQLERWRAQGDGVFNTPIKHPGDLETLAYSLYRQPIGEDRLTLSASGAPLAPLMGGFCDYDGGETAFHFGRLSFASATNDYIALVQILPVGPEETNVVFTWLVDADAPDSIDPQAVSWMWDVTTQQDKRIVEDNALGVRSRGYRPGPYTPLEGQTNTFVQTYLREMTTLLDDAPRAARRSA